MTPPGLGRAAAPAGLKPRLSTVRGAEQAIGELWDSLGVQTRAATGNLVALTERAHLKKVEGALAGLQGRYAGRQIIGVLDGDDADEVQVTVSLVPQEGGRYVERLVLSAGEEQLRGAILPLLRPATLNYIWWAAERRPGGPLLTELTELADKVICDSLTLDISPGRHYALADLGWPRLSGWREALAQLFDRPEAARQLPGLSELRLTYAGQNPLPAQLYGAWVADTLGWPGLGTVTVESDDCGRENGDLCGVELSGAGTRFLLEAGEGGVIHARAEWSGGGFQSSLHLRRLPLTAGLAELLADARPHPAFERAWARVRAEPRWAAERQAR
ncbi:Glucose-6-phosphate dehydrogenase subunit [Deinococcus proteolyticus MRP]|uniref:Glucose-6-phosphate dehydrogenase subunit n=1 Tax=Deinococcus proteolyticus (strain ATCC 35074 / DSM 20540 / JCM 6276 / NBRC 101906 / NCIMB 13154 / VKM Ac-1939 / CCM 2703 / MRP) TaxID=693977 RepID=F0RK34_DEIPM|nr:MULTISPECIES: glucose-6-phosphate dehydrogenase assembly protein OpcA [Deinococcus]ADY26680.1 Glucose-6-phosphate dehydrogenase subunit [Deinococcus proteolyticus MRP]MCY1702808.1 glucose-6-phosphate dehydrogenase assembly protein OpcA [Deinococcus sp. SL84]